MVISFSIYVAFSILLSISLFFFSYQIVNQKPNLEKISSYECGFIPFDDARSRFEIKFYVVAILFVIFDLEITLIFPWAISFFFLGFFGLFVFYIFIGVLSLAFLLEWYRGLLDF